MLQNIQLTIAGIVNNPKTRIAFILGTIVLAALVGAAPHDTGG